MPFGEQQIKIVAKLVDSKDASVRENAMCVLAQIYKVLDEDIWRVMGQVPLKVKGLLETRFRKVKGLGASNSKSNLNSSIPRNNLNASRTTFGSKAAASPKGKDPLTKSFNPGLKTTQTPRATGLKFNNKQESSQEQSN